MDEDLDTRLLRAFVTTVHERSLSRAAARLLISQQGLSRQIQRLETLTGSHLFVRSGTGMSLSEAGERLLPDAEAVLNATALLFTNVGGRSGVLLAEIRGRHMMQDLWEMYRVRRPDITATFRDLTGGQQLAALRRGDLDVAMTWPPEDDDILAYQVLRFDRVIVLDAGAPRTFNLATDDLAFAPVAVESRGWEEFCARLEKHLGRRFARLPYDMTMLDAVARAQLRGEAQPMIALQGVLDNPAATRFQCSYLEGLQPYYPWHLAWRLGERNRRVLEFVNASIENAATKGWLDVLADPETVWIPPHAVVRSSDHGLEHQPA